MNRQPNESRSKCTFKKADIRRAVEAAESTGKPVAGVSYKNGEIFVRFGDPLTACEKGSDGELEDLIAEIKANGKARRAT
jgi:hypothetical protein